MTQYLLAIEADQIQDFIFRSSRLREVVGGSQLLTRFGDATNPSSALRQLLSTAGGCEIITAGGGNFRLIFDDLKRALRFGEELSEVYRLTTGGTLSVAEPVRIGGDDAEAGKQAERNLRLTKHRKGGAAGTAHLPYTALCASCGLGLATGHDKREGDTEKRYICPECSAKNEERRTNEAGEFLEPFFRKIMGDLPLDKCRWPGNDPSAGSEKEKNDPTASIAGFDHRSYVAYVLADANNMGRAFEVCDREQARRLSLDLSDILRESLAEPARILKKAQNEADRMGVDYIPVLPLILGGDDIFALIPAPWALDFAYRLCSAFDEKMKREFEELKISTRLPSPTISAAVVICKSNYPYYLAYRTGEKRLREAKRVAKGLTLREDLSRSAINYEIITGSQLVHHEDGAGDLRNTLRPYWAGAEEGPVPPEWGESIETLIDQRKELIGLPGKRRAQLRAHFDDLRWAEHKDMEEKKKELYSIVNRIGRDKKHGEKIRRALRRLGDGNEGGLRDIGRIGVDANCWSGHGLPDLLDAWHFTMPLDVPRSVYEES